MGTTLKVRDVTTGDVFDRVDDGHEKDPNKPLAYRAQLVGLFAKRAPDGGPQFYLLEAGLPFVHGKMRCSPLQAPVWSEAENARLEGFRAANAERRARAQSRVKARAGARLPLAEQMAKSKDRQDRAAGVAAVATKAPAKAKAAKAKAAGS